MRRREKPLTDFDKREREAFPEKGGPVSRDWRDIPREGRDRRPSPKPRRIPPGEIIDDSGMFRKRRPSPVSRRRLEDEKKRVPPKYKDEKSGRATGLDVDEIKRRDEMEEGKNAREKKALKEKKRKIKDERRKRASLRRRRQALRRARKRRRMRRSREAKRTRTSREAKRTRALRERTRRRMIRGRRRKSSSMLKRR